MTKYIIRRNFKSVSGLEEREMIKFLSFSSCDVGVAVVSLGCMEVDRFLIRVWNYSNFVPLLICDWKDSGTVRGAGRSCHKWLRNEKRFFKIIYSVWEGNQCSKRS